MKTRIISRHPHTFGKFTAKKLDACVTHSPFDCADDTYAPPIAIIDNLGGDHKPLYVGCQAAVIEKISEAIRCGDLYDAIFYSDDPQPVQHVLGCYDLSDDKARDIALIMQRAVCSASPSIVCNIAKLVTGEEWDWLTMTGSVQGEMVFLIFITNGNDADDIRLVHMVEKEWFNLGDEWQVFDPDDNYLANVYTTSDGNFDIREEIADEVGCNPSELVLLNETVPDEEVELNIPAEMILYYALQTAKQQLNMAINYGYESSSQKAICDELDRAWKAVAKI